MHKGQDQVNIVEVYHNCTNGSAPLNKRAARALDKKYLKQNFLLNHWSKFKIITQNCSS